MVDPLLTQSVDQLARATAVSPDALTAVQEPGGPLQSIEIKRLLGRLIQTDTAKPDVATLNADLGHDANSVALVYSDATPTNNGWYRKTGASGAGAWSQFEKLSSYVLPLVEQAGVDLASGIETIKETVVANGPLRTTGKYGIMDVDATGITSRYVRPDGTQVFGAIETSTLSLSPFPLVDPMIRHAVVDPTGVAMFAVSSAGVLDVQSVDANALPLIDPSVRIAVIDATGVASYRVGGDQAVPAAVALRPSGWGYDWYIRAMKNQSLGQGYVATPALSTMPKYGSLMLSTGLRTGGVDDFSAATLVPHVEADVLDNLGNGQYDGESAMRISADQIVERLAAENGIAWTSTDFRVVSLITGQSGASIAEISPGTAFDNRGRAALARIAALAQVAGRTAGLASMPWMIGESDTVNHTPVATIIAAMEANRASWDAYAKGLFGQTNDVQLISYQTSSHSGYGVAYPYAAIAQWQASLTNPNIHLACPIYWADCVDQAHIVNTSEQMVGAYMARCEKTVVLDGKPWTPLQPRLIEVQGKIAVARFDVPVAPIVFDTSLVSDPGDFGLKLHRQDGTVVVLDKPPEIVSADCVRFTATTTIPAAVELRIGWLPGPRAEGAPWAYSGRLTGPRSCLRDSAGLTDVIDCNGITRPLHNYAVISFVRSAAWIN